MHSFADNEKHSFRILPPRRGAAFVLALGAYFLLHLLIRINVSDFLDLDEAEAVIASRELRAGYGSQPPLYNWLQWLMFQLFGLNLFALSALKNLLLFATYLSMFGLAKPLIGTRGAMTASASLLLFPQIGWESQRDLTHSVLLTTLACATLWCYFALLRKPVAAYYALFGLLIGLGLQAKYNFAVFLAGLMSASLLVKEHRQTLWNRRTGISAAIAFMTLLPHGLWLLNNLGSAVSGTLDKMAEGTQQAGFVRNVATGMASMVTATFSFVALAAMIYGLAGRDQWKPVEFRWRDPHARFFIALYAGFFLVLTCVLLSSEVGKFKDRWLQPLLFSLPLACFLWWPALAQGAVYRRILAAVAVVAMMILLGIPLRAYLGPAFNRNVQSLHPYSELAEKLARRFPNVPIITDEKLIAGNLYFQRPALRTLLSEDLLKRPGTLPEEALIVTYGSDGNAESDLLERFLATYPGCMVQEQGQLNLQLRGSSAKSVDFYFILITFRKP
ncbi:ArnT family glycosyltransferase [Noviherbaspirillum aerium]|uniref:ArnT family glycosyltransferase n=1 Tax=Noviherbaspirillum aerium TaxID=2588497 RepID=UPI00124EE855|nr:glycosyltransferase family 39 protein [Noviherbaspirillum aerium]